MRFAKFRRRGARAARVAAFGTALLAPLWVSLAALAAPRAGGAVAAVFPPWWGAAAVLRAGVRAGTIVRMGRVHFVVVVAAADPAALRAAGAWLLLDPLQLGWCTGGPPAPAPSIN